MAEQVKVTDCRHDDLRSIPRPNKVVGKNSELFFDLPSMPAHTYHNTFHILEFLFLKLQEGSLLRYLCVHNALYAIGS